MRINAFKVVKVRAHYSPQEAANVRSVSRPLWLLLCRVSAVCIGPLGDHLAGIKFELKGISSQKICRNRVGTQIGNELWNAVVDEGIQMIGAARYGKDRAAARLCLLKGFLCLIPHPLFIFLLGFSGTPKGFLHYGAIKAKVKAIVKKLFMKEKGVAQRNEGVKGLPSLFRVDSF